MQQLEFPNKESEYFENKSIQKAVLLTRYVNFMKHYLQDSKNKTPSINFQTGITIPQLSRENKENGNNKVKKIICGLN